MHGRGKAKHPVDIPFTQNQLELIGYDKGEIDKILAERS
jgi:hypothetical protein